MPSWPPSCRSTRTSSTPRCSAWPTRAWSPLIIRGTSGSRRPRDDPGRDAARSRRPDPAVSVTAQNLRQRITDAILDLPEREQFVLGLRYYQEMRLAEIGEILGVTESRVSQLHAMAVLHIRARLPDELELPRGSSALALGGLWPLRSGDASSALARRLCHTGLAQDSIGLPCLDLDAGCAAPEGVTMPRLDTPRRVPRVRREIRVSGSWTSRAGRLVAAPALRGLRCRRATSSRAI